MGTTQGDCIEALRAAADRLGESPSKAAYEELDITPSSTTILRLFDGWNDAKERAGLETLGPGDRGGGEIQPQPDGVDIPPDAEWETLTAQQRWYYKNRAHRIAVKDSRRQRFKRWSYEFKREELSCAECGEGSSPALDFHHEGVKGSDVSAMVNDGYSKATIREEIDRCTVLCVNCHRQEHYDGPVRYQSKTRTQLEGAIEDASKHEARKLRRAWLVAYRRDSDGCTDCEVLDPRCLDFHHEESKEMTVSRMVSNGRRLPVIREEIEACRLLCANCHRQEHYTPPGQDS